MSKPKGDLGKGAARLSDRTQARAKVDIHCEVGGVKGASMGRVRDLTENGLRVFCRHDYAPGATLGVTLQIPGFSQRFDFVAKVKWMDLGGSTDIYELGCEIVHTPQSRAMIKSLLMEMGSGNLPEVQRKAGQKTQRFRITPPARPKP